MRCLLIFSLVSFVYGALDELEVYCHPKHMEVCWSDVKNKFLWAEGNLNNAMTGDKEASCTSFLKTKNNETMSCGITMYSAKNVDTPALIDDIDRYNCNNKQQESSNGGLLTIENTMAQRPGAVSVGTERKYIASCTYNLRFEGVQVVLEIPEVNSKFTTDQGEFNADMKMCTTRECKDYYALPASSTPVGDEYVMQITTVGAGLYPRLRNCWASPAAPVDPRGSATPHSFQLQIVKDFCRIEGLAVKVELVVGKKDAVDEVRLITPSFSFFGAKDSTGDALEFTFVMCEVAIGLSPTLGVGEGCHLNGADTTPNRTVRRVQNSVSLSQSWFERILEGDEATATVGGAFSIDKATVTLGDIRNDGAAGASLVGVMVALFQIICN